MTALGSGHTYQREWSDPHRPRGTRSWQSCQTRLGHLRSYASKCRRKCHREELLPLCLWLVLEMEDGESARVIRERKRLSIRVQQGAMLFRRLGKWKPRPDVNRLRLGFNRTQRSTPLPRHPSTKRCARLGKHCGVACILS